ncbi:MAG: pyridoxal phosphate-dependent aminotransferase [Filifactoraceae bacterium]
MFYSRKYSAIEPSVTLAISAKAAMLRSEGHDIISFSVGEPDFKTPKFIREYIKENIDELSLTYTPASGLRDLKEAISKKYNLDNNVNYDSSEIVISNGAKHALHNAIEAITNPEDEIIIISPFWVSYIELVKMAGGVPVIVKALEENDFEVNIDDIKNSITNKTKAIIVNSPSNPTGVVYSEELLRSIAELALEKEIIIISDEIYEKLIYSKKHFSIASISEEVKNITITINGISKAYAMTGWRIGYSASNKEIAKIISNIQSHGTSSPNTLAQYASIIALNGPQDDVKYMKDIFEERRNIIVNEINKIKNLKCQTPNGAFYVMVNIKKLIGKNFNGKLLQTSVDVAEYLIEEGKIAVVPGAAFGVDSFIRMSYATSNENIYEGIKRLKYAVELLDRK